MEPLIPLANPQSLLTNSTNPEEVGGHVGNCMTLVTRMFEWVDLCISRSASSFRVNEWAVITADI